MIPLPTNALHASSPTWRHIPPPYNSAALFNCDIERGTFLHNLTVIVINPVGQYGIRNRISLHTGSVDIVVFFYSVFHWATAALLKTRSVRDGGEAKRFQLGGKAMVHINYPVQNDRASI
jgi:hypothetical protein